MNNEQQKNTISNYGVLHRPANPLQFPDEMCTIDKISNGIFFPKDILLHPEFYFSPNLMVSYHGNSVISTLKTIQNNPDADVCIYRGAPSDGVLNQGDWVTLSYLYAKLYAKNGICCDNASSRVYKYKVKAKNISWCGDCIFEFGYWGKTLKNSNFIKEETKC